MNWKMLITVLLVAAAVGAAGPPPWLVPIVAAGLVFLYVVEPHLH